MQAKAPHLFLQHFCFPRQSESLEHLLEQTHGPEGAGQRPGFTVNIKSLNLKTETMF